MKKFIICLIGLAIGLFILLNNSSVSRTIRKLHLFNSGTLLKSSSFDAYTIEVFQEKNQLRVEIYSSHEWFTEDEEVFDISVPLDKSDVSVIWKQVHLETKEDGVKNVVLASVEVTIENEKHQYYGGTFSDTDVENLEDFFHLLEIDVYNNPSKID
ncbi:TPA: hypothetical protein VCA72_000114 [Streptococcus suis]|nr:hypothetical protein [Streptococcus suis]